MSDPNWFFSSLSQSAAAIIGLLGAVLGSRLLHQLSMNRQSKKSILDGFRVEREKIKNAHKETSDCLQYLVNDITLCEQVLKNNKDKRYIGGKWSFFTHMPYSSGREEVVTLEEIESQKRDKEICEQLIVIFESILNMSNLKYLDNELMKFNNFGKSMKLVNDKKKYKEYRKSIETICRESKLHMENILPRSTMIILGILIWLSVFGLILPLGFLFAGSLSTWKNIILITFSIGIVGLIIYLGILISEVRSAGNLHIPTHKD